jgi:hypothetical protein
VQGLSINQVPVFCTVISGNRQPCASTPILALVRAGVAARFFQLKQVNFAIAAPRKAGRMGVVLSGLARANKYLSDPAKFEKRGSKAQLLTLCSFR